MSHEISNFITNYMNYFGISGYLKTNEAGTNIQYYPAKEGGFVGLIIKIRLKLSLHTME